MRTTELSNSEIPDSQGLNGACIHDYNCNQNRLAELLVFATTLGMTFTNLLKSLLGT